MNEWGIVLAVGATFRVTRFVTRDYITERPRRWVIAHVSDPVAYLMTCSWCVSIYVSALIAPCVVVWGTNRAVQAVLVGLTASGATGLLSGLDPVEDFGVPVLDDVDG